MATDIVATERYMVSTIIQFDAQAAVLNRYYKAVNPVGGGPNPTDLEFAIQFDLLAQSLYKALICNAAAYLGCIVRRVSGTPPLELGVFTTVSSGSGTAGATAMAKQTAGLISLTADFAGKTYAGRQYVPFPATADDQGAGVPTPAYRVLCQSLLSMLLGTITLTRVGTTIDMVPCTHTRGSNFTAPFTNGKVGRYWATQRRRGDYGKANKSPI